MLGGGVVIQPDWMNRQGDGSRLPLMDLVALVGLEARHGLARVGAGPVNLYCGHVCCIAKADLLAQRIRAEVAATADHAVECPCPGRSPE